MQVIDPNRDVPGYVSGLIPGLSDRLGLGLREITALKSLLMVTYRNESAFQSVIDGEKELRTYMPSTEESKALVGFLSDRLMRSWEIEGMSHLLGALDFYRSGGNVVIMSNHTGVIDAPVADYILRRALSEEYPMTWVAGKRVWESVFLRMFSRCVDLLTMFGEKYVQVAAGTPEFDRMRARNVAMLRWMRSHRSVWFAYPQGTWCNTGRLTPGKANVMDILGTLGGRNYENTMVLPAFLDGPEKIVPPSEKQKKGEDDFGDFLELLTPGEVSYRFGPPLSGRELAFSQEEGIRAVMYGIADLAPTEEARGPYAQALR